MYDIHPKLILRTPRLSFDQFFSKPDINDQAQSDSFLEAVYLASPDLAQLLATDERKLSAASNAIAKYFIRSCFRPTPFGMFAGVSVAEWDKSSNIEFEKEVRHVRLDLQYLNRVAKQVLKVPRLKKTINFTANNSIYTTGGKLRYIESTGFAAQTNYQLSELEITEELQSILAVSANPISYKALVDILILKGCLRADAEIFIDALIDNKILVSELEPTITGDDYLNVLIEKLRIKKHKDLARIVSVLEGARTLMKTVDEAPSGIKTYEGIKAHLSDLPQNNECNTFLHVDLLKTTRTNSLSSDIRRNLKEGLEVLVKLAGRIKNDTLDRFKTRFIDRYGEKEVPLLEVLDGDVGIGYPDSTEGDVTSLTKGLILSPESENVAVTITKRDRWLQQKLQHALFHHQYGITIEPKEISGFETDLNILPASFSAIFRVTNFSDNEIYIEGVGGSSGIQTLGRFAYADEEIKNLASDIAEAEKKSHPSAVVAEIVHLPEARIGNVLAHPSFYDYEIPFLTTACPKTGRIETQDLYLRIEAGKIRLVSRKLNTEVIPRLSNANNFKLSVLSVYRFLCDLQTEKCLSNLSFNWGPFSEDAVFLPRVTYGKAILHAASWSLGRSEWENLLYTSPDDIPGAIKEFRAKWRMPRLIALVEFDEELFIDLDNRQNVLAWLSAIRQKNKIVLKEYLFDQDPPIRDAAGGRYISQFIATLTKQPPTSIAKDDLKIPRAIPELNRTYYPGTEWIYLKFYCSIKSTDEIIVRCIKPLTANLLKDKLINAWFFVRYKDPDPHLRVRLKLTDIKAFSTVLERASAYLKDVQKRIWRIQLDTYERELERYGMFALQAETLFFLDSIAIVNILNKLNRIQEKEEFRWLLSLRVIDTMLNDFAFTLDDKIKLMKRLQSSFSKEFNIQKPSRIEIDKKYRHFKPEIESIINHDDSRYLSYSKILERRSRKMQPIIKTLCHIKIAKTSVIQSVEQLVESFIHLSLNRLLSHTHRLQERIIYDFLWRFYTSEKARQLTKTAKQALSNHD